MVISKETHKNPEPINGLTHHQWGFNPWIYVEMGIENCYNTNQPW
jgi:hypothetical protein